MGRLPNLSTRRFSKSFPRFKMFKVPRRSGSRFRHGILHQATFSLRRVGGSADFSGVVGFERVSGAAIVLRRSGDPEHIVCIVDPIVFARNVLSEVEHDFETFRSAEHGEHPIALVENVSGGIYSFVIPLKGI
jgi:hypothetical protein